MKRSTIRHLTPLGQKLAEWLNTDSDPPYNKQVGEIVEQLNAVTPPQKWYGESGWGFPPGTREETPSGRQKRGRVSFESPEAAIWYMRIFDLNQKLRECSMYPQLDFPYKGRWVVGWKTQSDFAAFLYPAIELAHRGELQRVRRCKVCGKWFYASHPRRQSSCSERCRKNKYLASPTGRAWKRRYMKEFMRRKRAAERKRGK